MSAYPSDFGSAPSVQTGSPTSTGAQWSSVGPVHHRLVSTPESPDRDSVLHTLVSHFPVTCPVVFQVMKGPLV